ncbi:hypothetical protein [Algoriphagus boritolerans]|uniref:hypothetical protein n=1 Tax=Algoriphagus boritolerans TaxID=308111 RepID=UPI000B0EEBEB
MGLLFESFVVQLDEKGRLSLANQNISSANASEFDSGLDEADYKLIRIMDSMQPEVVIKPYMKKGNIKPKEFLAKIYDAKTADPVIQELVSKKIWKSNARKFFPF